MLNKLLGTARPLQDKTIAITGASGTLGRALIDELLQEGAKAIALTTSPQAQFPTPVQVVPWQLGQERHLQEVLHSVDILIINHGINVRGERHPEAIVRSLEVNALSVLALMDTFIATVDPPPPLPTKEIWINTSEAEVGPAFSPLYEISKRLIGDLITLKRRDAPCTLRKIILGPFKSKLNPIGVMSAPWVASAVVALAKRDFHNIVVTINPVTYFTFPIKENVQAAYFRLCSRSPQP